jgi:hypothetical protein
LSLWSIEKFLHRQRCTFEESGIEINVKRKQTERAESEKANKHIKPSSITLVDLKNRDKAIENAIGVE